MDSSRVFVKGLPPSLDEQDFRKHFSKRHNVNDIKLMPRRRMGYVGFDSAEDAQAAVKYFNKSFLRMSRLHVELADGVTSSSRNSNRQPPLESSAKTNPLKRKQGSHERRVIAPGEPKTPQSEASIGPEDCRNDHINGEEHGELTPQKAPETDESTSNSLESNRNAAMDGSDADWMRTHTSRLLGLVADENELHVEHKSSPPNDHNPESHLESSPGFEHASTSYDPEAADTSKEEAPHNRLAPSDGERYRRLFIRNLAYEANERHLKELLQRFGELREVNIPRDFKTGGLKGFAFVEFENFQNGQKAFHELDGSTFQGRLLHILPAAAKRHTQIDDFTLAKLPLKKRRRIEKRQQNSASVPIWNSMFMNADAVLASTAERLGIPKSEVLDPASSDAAVKQAHAETHTIQEAKEYFHAVGVNINSFSSNMRDGNTLLVKNFKFKTSAEDLKKLFSANSNLEITRVLIPPAGTIAIIEFANATQASVAAHEFAYRRFNDSVLFVERGPRDLFNQHSKKLGHTSSESMNPNMNQKDDQRPQADELLSRTSLFVGNLNFDTNQQKLWEEFKSLDGLVSVLVKTRPDPNNSERTLSMGFGFLEFRTPEQAKLALAAINGTVVDEHELQISPSRRGQDAASERRREDQIKRQKERTSKIVIKNLPFEASKKDLRNLLSPYGQLRALRMPKKMNSTTRGYAFAQFKTPKEAENAIETLKNTHLLGRRLILEYTTDEPEDPEEQIEKMQERIGRQSDSVALQSLKSNQRRKLLLDDSNEADAS